MRGFGCCGCGHDWLLGKQRRGAQPGVYRRANTAVLRHVVQSLEKMRILDKDSNG